MKLRSMYERKREEKRPIEKRFGFKTKAVATIQFNE